MTQKQVIRIEVHEYLFMTLDYTVKGELNLDLRKYVKNMIDEFPIHIKKLQAVTRPSTKKLFKVGRSNSLNNNKAGLFNTIVARGLFLCKGVRPDN